MKSFAVVHNITTPYRVHLFRVLDEELRARDVALHVHFMTRSFGFRPADWQIGSSEMPFEHTFWPNIGPEIRGVPLYVNPGLVAHLARRPADYLMVGAPWASFTGVGVSLLGRRGVGIGWVEGNTHTPGRLGGLLGRAKRAVFERFDIWAVPGEEGRRHAALVLGRTPPDEAVAYLPNLVDERAFGSRPADPEAERRAVRSSLDVPVSHRLAVWPARLKPAKGVVEFLSRLRPSDLEGWSVLILGEGRLRPDVEGMIRDRGLGDRVRLAGTVHHERMPAIYRAADLFLLPSLKDPNPLSVVEAMHAGLPILVSERIGNYPEALEPGRNGWGVDPGDPDSVQRAIDEAFSASPERLAALGQRSREVARERWGSRSAVRRFLDSIPVPNGAGGSGDGP